MPALINNLLKIFIPTKDHIKVSIIIPVYNAENSLSACIESAINQTLYEIEIICVDDNSQDNSYGILTQYSEKDHRISIIRHNINKGEGEARNTGVYNARGEYIFHLDSDDTLPSDAIECLYAVAISNKSELVKGRLDVINTDGKIIEDKWSTPVKTVINTNIYISDFLQKIPISHVTYLYSHKLLTKHKITYDSDLTVGLDIVALTKTLTVAKNVSLIPKPVYYYHQNDTSVTRGNISLKIAQDSVKAKAITADILFSHGLHNAAISKLKAWEYIVDTFWVKMSSNLDNDECTIVFNNFRNLLLKYRIKEPWSSKTSKKHKQILELIISEQDMEAISLLKNSYK